ncbi:MAG: HEPN domain-containing protein [Pseudomonadota bacterium]|nr:HEPN domain-containing protein [Pseudomonadota bacterium]
MTKGLFERALVRKGKKALKVARLALNAGDNDSAVSRSYYAMFDIAQAALLRAGVSEDKLPRTHNGIIEAFRSHAIQSGKIDRQLATQLSRTESLRIKADYTGTEIELSEAKEVVRNAELFVQTVERVFSLDTSSLVNEYENPKPKDDDKVSEPDVAASEIETKTIKLEPISLEEVRRQARENWLKLRQQLAREAKKGASHAKDANQGTQEDQGHSIDDDPV